MPTTNPLQKLKILSGAVQLPNQATQNQDDKILSSRSSLLNAVGLNPQQQQLGENKKVSSALNTLRGLESGRTIKTFENLGNPQTQTQNQMNQSQPSFITMPYENSKEMEQKSKEEKSSKGSNFNEYEELKVEEDGSDEKVDLNRRPSVFSEEFKQKKIQEIKNNIALPKAQEKPQPKKNYFAALTSIRNIHDDKIPSRNDNINKSKTKQQESHSKLVFDEPVHKLKPINQQSVIDKNEQRSSLVKKANLQTMQIPQSPYLANVKRKFEVAAQVVKPWQSSSKIADDSSKNQITSPYIQFSRGLPKEKRKEHIKLLKQHVESVIQKDKPKAKDIKNNLKLVPISNAFTLNIKNEREEVLKNMENLRKSVKLLKRANPLEKIITKIMNLEGISDDKSSYLNTIENEKRKSPPKPKTSSQSLGQDCANGISSFKINFAQPQKNEKWNQRNKQKILFVPLQVWVSDTTLSIKKMTFLRRCQTNKSIRSPTEKQDQGEKLIFQKKNEFFFLTLSYGFSLQITLINIDKVIVRDNDVEDDTLMAQNQSSKTDSQNDLRESINKKIGDLVKFPKNKKFAGMSPIITFRPMNKISNDHSSQNTPLGTPQILPRGAITSRDGVPNLNTLNIPVQSPTEEYNSQQQINLLQSAKKELDILENLKSIAIEIFNISLHVKQSSSQIKILEKYLTQINKIPKRLSCIYNEYNQDLYNYLQLIIKEHSKPQNP